MTSQADTSYVATASARKLTVSWVQPTGTGNSDVMGRGVERTRTYSASSRRRSRDRVIQSGSIAVVVAGRDRVEVDGARPRLVDDDCAAVRTRAWLLSRLAIAVRPGDRIGAAVEFPRTGQRQRVDGVLQIGVQIVAARTSMTSRLKPRISGMAISARREDIAALVAQRAKNLVCMSALSFVLAAPAFANQSRRLLLLPVCAPACACPQFVV